MAKKPNKATQKPPQSPANAPHSAADETQPDRPRVKDPNLTGRPSDYTPEMAATICARMAEGESVRKICADPAMPSTAAVFRWLQKHTEFRELYEQALEQRLHGISDSLLDIADDGTNDWVEKRDADGNVIAETVNSEHIQRSRLRVDTRKWLLAKLMPRVYGDKTAVEHSGSVALEQLVNGAIGTKPPEPK